LPDRSKILARAATLLDMVHLFAIEAAGLAGKLKRLGQRDKRKT
jgi:hypothetical protein